MIDAGTVAVLAPFLMVIGIVWVKSREKLEEKRIAAAGGRENVQRGTQNSARIEELEERVRVLERIVTDGGYDLATQIEALRDERGIGARHGAAEIRETI